MDHFTLRKHTDNTILYEGRFGSLNQCLEAAVNDGTKLSHINLRNQNLTNVNIDGASMPYASFSGSNLSGANLSEAVLSNANFKNASLYNCCMSYSDLRGCDFLGANFGGTLIDGADLGNGTFSTLSCFDLDFVYCKNLNGSRFIEPDNRGFEMSGAPIVIKGLLNVPIILFDETVKIGDRTLKRSAMPQLLKVLSAYTYQQVQDNNKAA